MPSTAKFANTNRLVGTETPNNIIHYSTKNRDVKIYSNVTLKLLRIINATMCYVILGSPWKPKGQYRGRIIHVEKTCVLLRAIKHAICSLPLAPNAQSANLTLTSNPLTRKRTNARTVYSTSDKQIHFLCECVEWHSIDESPIFVASPISFDSPSLFLSPPPSIQPDGLPLTEQ